MKNMWLLLVRIALIWQIKLFSTGKKKSLIWTDPKTEMDKSIKQLNMERVEMVIVLSCLLDDSFIKPDRIVYCHLCVIK